MKVFSFFSGIGGNSIGYKKAGAKVIFANEILKSSADSYEKNHGLEVCRSDIRTLKGQDLLDQYGIPDVVDGSPPCASYSMSGKREAGFGKTKSYANEYTQTTDDLLEHFTRLVFEIKPKMVCFENVVGLTQGTMKNILNDLYHRYTSEGYLVKAQILNSADYGVPQIRRRLFFRANQKSLGPPTFPSPYGIGETIAKALKDVENTREELHERDFSDQAIYKKWVRLKQGTSDPKWFNLVRTHPHKICPTVTATSAMRGASGVTHWDEPRKFTYKEMLILSGFPKDFEFIGTQEQACERLARVVTPPVMAALAKEMLGQL
jgi:DNA (cytosine-5)-methyltransferase 1